MITADIAAGSVWYRLYRNRFPNPLGCGFGSSRFSDPEVFLSPPDRFGVVYLGNSIKVCFAEAIMRDRGVGAGPSFPIELAELRETSCAEIEVVESLRLADLRGDGMLRMRIPTDVARAKSHDLGQIWSRAIWLHDQKPDGIIYDSRLNDETNIAIFNRALLKLSARSVVPLMDHRTEMARIITDFGLAIVA